MTFFPKSISAKAIILSEQQLEDVSKRSKLESEIIKVNGAKMAILSATFINQDDYGSEEFVLLMHDIDYQVAISYCKDLIQQIAHYGWAVIAPNLKVTISIGLAHYPDTAIDNLFSAADKMLYKAKMSGRNKLVYKT